MVDVLIAEDTELQSRLIRSFLRSEHDIVGTAHDGMEAIAMAQMFEPDVIVMDINMPNTDGIRATKEAKDLDPDVSIIISTVVLDDETIEEARNAGADEVLTKPYSKEELLDAIDDAVG